MHLAKHYIFIIIIWVFAIQFNEVVSHFDSDVMEMQHEKEGEKEAEKENLKIREWNEFLGLNSKDYHDGLNSSSLNLHHSLFHQWLPDIVIPPPEDS